MGLPLSDEEIEQIVAWRMGHAFNSPIVDWRSNWLNFDNSITLKIAMAVGLVVQGNEIKFLCPPNRDPYDPWHSEKLPKFAESFTAYDPNLIEGLSIFIARQDARIWTSLEYMGQDTELVSAQLSSNRPISSFQPTSWQQHILWPHPYQVGRAPVPETGDPPWHKRDGNLFWLGVISGSRYDFKNTGLPTFDGLRQASPFLTTWLDNLATGTAVDWDVNQGNYQRLVAAMRFRARAGINIKLTPWEGRSASRPIEWLKRQAGADIVAERLDRARYLEERRKHKFTLAIPGNDEPSSLREDLVSGSCLLMPRPFFESGISYGLNPGEHYIELKMDMSDLEEKLEWCRDHDAECREIAQRAFAYGRAHLDRQTELAIQRRVIEIIKKNTVTGGPARAQ